MRSSTPRFGRARAATAVVALSALVTSFAAPSAAAIAAPTITSPVDGAVKKASFTITGTGTPGTTVQVLDGATALGTTTVAGNTGWALTVTLADGPHRLTATASDGTETSPPSTTVAIEVDGIRPSATITAPVEDHVYGAGQQPRIQGTATDSRALAAVRLEYWRLGSFVRAELADCTCSGTSASWSHEPILQPGEWTVKALAADEANNYSLSRQVRFVTVGGEVPFSDPELPELPIAPPAILSPGDGALVPGAERPVQFGGTTEPGSVVELYEEVHGVGTIGTAVDADEDGAWTMTARLPSGTYQVRARATDDEGNVSDPSEAIEFIVDGERPLVGLLTPDKQVFLPMQPIVVEGVVSDNYEVAAVVVEYFDVHGRSRLRELAQCIGCPAEEANWRHQPSLPFGPGHYTVKVWALDVAGNGSHKQTLSIIKTL